MPIIDVILIVILAGFVFYGLFFGFIRTLGAFVGLFVAAFVAGRLYLPVSEYADRFFWGYDNLGKAAVFLVLFSLCGKLASLFFYILHKSLSLISIIPFVKTINRLGGLVFGFACGSLVIGLSLHFVSGNVLIGQWLSGWLGNSQFAPFFLKFANVLLPFFPEALGRIKGII